ncbi:thioesterase domain-containing protein [Amycolatopsis mediterranei]
MARRGHGRYREPCAQATDELLEPLTATVVAEFGGPLVVAGHSLGGVLGFELACG